MGPFYALTTKLLSNPILQEYVDVIEAMGGGLCEVLEEEMAQFVYQYESIELGKPKMVFGNDIICFDVQNKEIAVGDTVIAKTGQQRRPFIAGMILELRSDDVVIQAVPPSTQPVRLGIKIGFRANEEHVYSWVPSSKVLAPAAVVTGGEPESAFEVAPDLESASDDTDDFVPTTVDEQAVEAEPRDQKSDTEENL